MQSREFGLNFPADRALLLKSTLSGTHQARQTAVRAGGTSHIAMCGRNGEKADGIAVFLAAVPCNNAYL
jgi:hypothetical protein